jgi:hypothetical protein
LYSGVKPVVGCGSKGKLDRDEGGRKDGDQVAAMVCSSEYPQAGSAQPRRYEGELGLFNIF